MKRVVQFICILLFCSIIFSSIGSEKVYSSVNQVTVTVGSNYADRSNEVKIPISLSNMPDNGVSGMSFSLQFDEALTFKDITNGELISESKEFSYFIKDNKINFLYSDSTGGDKPLKTAGVLCYLSFTVKESYKTSFKINRIKANNEKFIDKYYSNIEPTFVDGNIMIKDNLYRAVAYKTWKVTFNSEISSSSLTNNSVEIKNMKGENIDCSLSVSDDGKTLLISPPSGGYKLCESYSISINKEFESSKGRKLSKEQNIYFYVEK